jgi:putative aldouronate transport system substrate-binding protein
MKKPLQAAICLTLTASLMLTACGGEQSGSNPSASGTKAGDGKQDDKTKVYELKWSGLGNYPFKDGTYGQKFMEDTFNVKITPVRVDNNEKLNILVSTGDVPDLMVLGSDELVNYVKNDVLAEIPIDLIKQHAPQYYEIITKQEQKAFSNVRLNGKNYSLPRIDANVGPYPVAIRGDWLKAVGADIPVTLQQYEDLFVKFRNNDPDKNGKKDTYGLTMASTSTNSWFNTIFGAFGTNPFIWHERDGKLVNGFTLNETKDALKLLNKWSKMDLIDPEFITDKSRTSGKDDVAYKFASGRIGFLDNLSYDDHQWDNDGHLNAKWVAQYPEWQQFFNNRENSYSTAPFTKSPESGPQPVYLNIKPPVGPNGKSGSFSGNLVTHYIVFGKQAAQDQGKMIRLLNIINSLCSDENIFVAIEIGQEGLQWERNKEGQRIFKADWSKNELYHPGGRNTGTGLFFDVTYNTNPDFLSVFGGARAVQRYEKTRKTITDIPRISNALQAPLPSVTKYADLKAMVQEYIMKAILGEVDIDATFDATVKRWNETGGSVLTKEANDWYMSTK